MSEVEDQYQQRINELFTVPEHLQTKNISMTEDMLSDQVLTGEFDKNKSSIIQLPKMPLFTISHDLPGLLLFSPFFSIQ